MKQLVVMYLTLILFAALGAPAQASITGKAVIDESVHVVFSFESINSTIWRENTSPNLFDPSCYFIVFATATNPEVTEDDLINSPFLVVGALIILNIALFIYRKVRRKATKV